MENGWMMDELKMGIDGKVVSKKPLEIMLWVRKTVCHNPINNLAIHENQKRSRSQCTEQVVGKFMLSRNYRFSPFFDKSIRSYCTQVSLKSKLELYYKMSTNPKLALQS